MRDTISHLKLKLVEAEEDTSCAALNRLRAKLRELMKDGQKADQQVQPVVVERSMQTWVDLSKSHEDPLRAEYERQQAELTQIHRSMRAVVTPVSEERVLPSEEETDTSALLSQLRNCEARLAELKARLDEKTAYAEALRRELDQWKASVVVPASEPDRVVVSLTTVMDGVAVVRERPKEPDKVSLFIYPRLQNTRTAGCARTIH